MWLLFFFSQSFQFISTNGSQFRGIQIHTWHAPNTHINPYAHVYTRPITNYFPTDHWNWSYSQIPYSKNCFHFFLFSRYLSASKSMGHHVSKLKNANWSMKNYFRPIEFTKSLLPRFFSEIATTKKKNRGEMVALNVVAVNGLFLWIKKNDLKYWSSNNGADSLIFFFLSSKNWTVPNT